MGYASLRALATIFEMDVDVLEQELYSMDKVISHYKDYPFWVRFTLGKGWLSYSRLQLSKIESFLAPTGIILCGISYYSLCSGGIYSDGR